MAKAQLTALLNCCEQNYLRLARLVTLDASVGSCQHWLMGPDHDSPRLQLSVAEQTRYTTTLELRQLCEQSPDYLCPQMQVRMYHDAQVAEVLSSQQISGLRSRYDYPNQEMHQRDEKYRVNHFLSEWLIFLNNQGRSDHLSFIRPTGLAR